jgi:uncharacterized membrane protein (UPF0127 family)
MFRCNPRALAGGLLLAIALPLTAGAQNATCPKPTETPTVNALRIAAPAANLTVRVANTPVTREYGLMCVRGLAPHTGMLFVFGYGDQPLDFWMKNTLIPLDMVFVRSSGVVNNVATNVPATSAATPGDKTNRYGFGAYVIELAAGEAASDGITAGVHLDLRDAPKAKN